MSATENRVTTLKAYYTEDVIFYPRECYIAETTGEEIQQSLPWALFAPEICGLAVSGIIIMVGILAALLLGYAILAMLFVGPLIGVLAGAWYIKRATKRR